MTFEKAQDLVLGAKNANRQLAQVSIFNSMVDGASTMKNLSEDDLQNLWGQSEAFTDKLYPDTGAGASATEDATALPVPLKADGTPDTAKLIKGKKYRSPSGATGTWDGTGFTR